MAFVPCTNVVQVNLVHKLHGQYCENTLYFYKTSAWTEVEMVDLMSAVISSWASNVMPQFSQDLTFTLVKARDLTTQTSLSMEQQVTPVVPGGVQVGAVPSNVAFSAKKVTGFAGRSARGRIYLAGLAESQIIGNEINALLQAAILTALENFIGDILTNITDVIHVHISRFFNGQPREVGLMYPVENWTSDIYVDSQRRRLTGRGR